MDGGALAEYLYNILKHNVIYVEQFQHFSALTRTCNKGFINHRDDEKQRRWWRWCHLSIHTDKERPNRRPTWSSIVNGEKSVPGWNDGDGDADDDDDDVEIIENEGVHYENSF